MDQDKIIQLTTYAQELARRHNELLKKEAQYSATAEELIPKIVRRLRQVNVLSDAQLEAVEANMKKSASSTLELLDEITKSISVGQGPTLGTPHRTPTHYDTFENVDISDFTIDISKLR